MKIAEYVFDTSSTPTVTTINPWYEFFNTPAIKNKIESYAFLNCGLEVEFRINGAPSFYGKFVASYEPMTNWRPTLPIPSIGAASTVSYTQRPHIYLSVEESQGGSLSLPFLYHKNWLTLSSSTEMQEMGEITLFPLTDIQTTNGEVGRVNISVYARACNVKLSGTTLTPVLQSGEIKVKRKSKKNAKSDEFQQPGPISGPAGVVADIAGQLSAAPVIGPYARATEMLAGGVGSLARLFGYARTPNLAPPIFTRPSPFGQMANTETSETVDRLVIDAKQGTTIDSRTAGLDGSDEMTVKSIATRESYLTSFNWSLTDTSGSILWRCNVTPSLVRKGLGNDVYTTPMAFAALPFRYWRGSIKFRFQVVSSMYHRGRYQVQWDPRGDATDDPSDRIEEVTTTTIDIASDKDVEVVIPFAQATSYTLVPSIGTEYFGSSPLTLLDGSNGMLSVSVLNELNTFGTSNPITLLVSVSMGEDCEFAGPIDLPSDYQLTPEPPVVQMQSDEVNIADPHASAANAPEASAEIVDQVEVVSTPDHTSEIFFGEKIFSFRSLLKRYNYNYQVKYFGDEPSSTTYCVEVASVLPRYPVNRGFDTTGTYTLNGNVTNFANLTLFTYITSAFVGIRGGMRWKINALGPSPVDDIEVHRSVRTRDSANFREVTLYDGDQSLSTVASGMVASGISSAGYGLTNARTQSGLEVELPYYSRFRFHSTDPTHYSGYSYDESNRDSMFVRQRLYTNGVRAHSLGLDMHCATGEDFNAFFFLNTPPLYEYTNSTG